MMYRPLLRTAALAVTLSFSGIATLAAAQPSAKEMGKPDKPDKPDKGGSENKPAKVSWSPKRVEMGDVGDDGIISVELSADKEVLGISLFTSGSLNGVLGLPDSFDIPEGETVVVEFELLETPDEAGRTIGGTVHVQAGGKHLAQPLAFSLKRLETGGSDDNGGGDDEDGELLDDDGSLPVSWLFDGESLRDITIDLFDSDGIAQIVMVANRDLENLGLWFTPSTSACVAASFEQPSEDENGTGEDDTEERGLEFDEDGNISFIPKGTEVNVTLELTNPDAFTCGGGTLHVRSIAGNSRSFPQIVGVRIAKGEGVEEETEDPEVVAPLAIVDAASFSQEPIAASQIISIFGIGLGSDDPAVFSVGQDGEVSEYLNGTMVLFDGYPAPLLSTSAGQINAIVPAAVKGGDVELQVLRNDRQSPPFPVAVGPPTPSLFILSGTQAAAINANGTLNGNANPARGGTVVSLFGTGAGPMITPLPDGAVADRAIRLAGAVRVFVGGVEATVQYAGTAPGLVAAAVQFNVQLSAQTPKGPQPVVVTVNGVESTGAATISVQ